MSDGAQFTHAHMVRFERHLPGPPAQAWSFLADTGRLPGWYGESSIEPRVGGIVILRRPPSPSFLRRSRRLTGSSSTAPGATPASPT